MIKYSPQYEFIDLAEWANDNLKLISSSTPLQTQSFMPENSFSQEGAHYQKPFDATEALALMTYQGGDNSIHTTQLRVTASMISAGVDIEKAVAVVLAATQKVAPVTCDWDWGQEETAIRNMCLSAREKMASGDWSGSISPSNKSWKNQLITGGKNDIVKPCLANVVLYLQHYQGFRGHLQYDSFSKKIFIIKPLTSAGENDAKPYPRELSDSDEILMRCWFQHHLKQDVKKSDISDAIIHAAFDNEVNLLTQKLDSLKWDGIPRIDTWLIDYAGAEDTPFNRAICRKFLISAIARAYIPGCKVDTMLILEGEQGLGKSSLVRLLCLNDDWFADQLPPLSSMQKAIEYIQGKWLIEIAELNALSGNQASSTKGFISSPVDRYRTPYARNPEDFKRQCVFMGTVNPEGGYLSDSTGGRRFWPVQCTKIDTYGLKLFAKQLWAEAIVAFKAKEIWWLTGDEEATAKEVQSLRYQGDEWDDIFERYLTHEPLPDSWGKVPPYMDWLKRTHPLNCIRIKDFLTQGLGILPKDINNKANVKRVKAILASKGWGEIQIRRSKKQTGQEGDSYRWFTKGGKLPAVTEKRSFSDDIVVDVTEPL